jgi:hypothetical protein
LALVSLVLRCVMITAGHPAVIAPNDYRIQRVAIIPFGLTQPTFLNLDSARTGLASRWRSYSLSQNQFKHLFTRSYHFEVEQDPCQLLSR